MTNGEKFKTASERKIAYSQYCDDCAENDKAVLSTFDWLDAEYVVKLKPCPFCGDGDVNTYKCNITDVWYVSCAGCGIRTEGDTSEDIAIAAWNRRAK